MSAVEEIKWHIEAEHRDMTTDQELKLGAVVPEALVLTAIAELEAERDEWHKTLTDSIEIWNCKWAEIVAALAERDRIIGEQLEVIGAVALWVKSLGREMTKVVGAAQKDARAEEGGES